MPGENEPTIAIKNNRPMRIMNNFDLASTVYVQCRVDGEDVFVPLKAVFATFERDMASKVRMGTGAKF